MIYQINRVRCQLLFIHQAEGWLLIKVSATWLVGWWVVAFCAAWSDPSWITVWIFSMFPSYMMSIAFLAAGLPWVTRPFPVSQASTPTIPLFTISWVVSKIFCICSMSHSRLFARTILVQGHENIEDTLSFQKAFKKPPKPTFRKGTKPTWNRS